MYLLKVSETTSGIISRNVSQFVCKAGLQFISSKDICRKRGFVEQNILIDLETERVF